MQIDTAQPLTTAGEELDHLSVDRYIMICYTVGVNICVQAVGQRLHSPPTCKITKKS